ncbi:MAG: hypothetical protein G01um101424_123 [Parcubacteria group bacterium Gr01-1014_24]|nr:MAG: hypothetical protein G01um101424_123 [Parcubacteria group bacterium Gr01-1014_24]
MSEIEDALRRAQGRKEKPAPKTRDEQRAEELRRIVGEAAKSNREAMAALERAERGEDIDFTPGGRGTRSQGDRARENDLRRQISASYEDRGPGTVARLKTPSPLEPPEPLTPPGRELSLKERAEENGYVVLDEQDIRRAIMIDWEFVLRKEKLSFGKPIEITADYDEDDGYLLNIDIHIKKKRGILPASNLYIRVPVSNVYSRLFFKQPLFTGNRRLMLTHGSILGSKIGTLDSTLNKCMEVKCGKKMERIMMGGKMIIGEPSSYLDSDVPADLYTPVERRDDLTGADDTRHSIRKFLFLRKIPEALEKPEEQASWLQQEIAELRRENERMMQKKELPEISSGFWDFVESIPRRTVRIPSRVFNSFKRKIMRNWNNGKIVKLSKKLEGNKSKIERESRRR